MLQFLKTLAWRTLPVTSIYLLYKTRSWIEFVVLKLTDLIAGRDRCVTKIKVHKMNYIWVISDFSLQKAKLMKGERLESSMFASATNNRCEWRLVLYPNGLANSNNNNVSLFLMLDHGNEFTNVVGEYKFSFSKSKYISYPEEKVVNGNRANKFVIGGKDTWGITDFIAHDECRYLPDTLTISCEAKFSDFTNASDQSNTTEFKPIVSEKWLSEDLRSLLKDEQFADVVLSVKGKDYRAHKSILAARSPVFAAMFRHENLQENQQNKVDIEDFDEQVIEEMLDYIYTGRPINLKQLAGDLLAAAEKYELVGLKEMSEKTLVSDLTVTNVIDMLMFSELYHAHKLKANAINFIVENSSKVMETTVWENIASSSHPHLVRELCEAFASKLRQK